MVCLVLAISFLLGQGLAVLPWALLILGVDLAVGRLIANNDGRVRRREAFALLLAAAIVAGVSVWINPTPVSGAFMLLLVPAYRAGVVWGGSGSCGVGWGRGVAWSWVGVATCRRGRCYVG